MVKLEDNGLGRFSVDIDLAKDEDLVGADWGHPTARRSMAKLDEVVSDVVLFECDKTCCICRDGSRPVQVHHIDGTHSNNDPSNLTVVCTLCHQRVHAKIPFSRELTPGLVRLYDKTWRVICANRLLPHTSTRELEEYRQEVLLELSLACHEWKNHYIALYPGHFQDQNDRVEDVWERLIKTGTHVDGENEWDKYRPLFTEAIDRTIKHLHTILDSYGDGVPISLKTLVIRTVRQLKVEAFVFQLFGPHGTCLNSRFEGVVRALAMLARSADSCTQASPVVSWHE